jgi:hypothetical protein
VRLRSPAGKIYTLDFDAGIFGQRTGAPLQMRAKVFDVTTSVAAVDQIITPLELR